MSSTAEILNSLKASQTMVADMVADPALQDRLDQAAALCAEAIRGGGRVYFAGNGGSAAEAQHFSAELIGRFLKERKPLPALSLHVDSSAVTAIGNDYGYDEVFARQLEGLAHAGDVLVAISTSGRSANVVKAMERARSLGVKTIALCGRDPRTMGGLADVVLNIPSDHTPQIQEGHLILGHLLCLLTEQKALS